MFQARARLRDGLRALFVQEDAVETWLRTEAAAAYDELRADSSQAISTAPMRAQIVQLHATRRTNNDA